MKLWTITVNGLEQVIEQVMDRQFQVILIFTKLDLQEGRKYLGFI